MAIVLVIDDSEAIAYAVRNALPDYEVLHATDGIEGLDLFRQHLANIALVVLDIQMPHLDGRAACVKIRSMSQDVPIVPFTGFPHEHTLNMLRELGCFAPLIKPAAPALIAQTLQAALQAAPPSAAASAALLSYTQELVTTQEQEGRAERAKRVIVYAADLSRRKRLKDLMEAAGVGVALLTGHVSNVTEALNLTSPLALVTTLGDLMKVKETAQHRNIPALVVAATLAEALALADLAQQPEMLRLGIVVENPFSEDDTALQITAALRALTRNQTFIPPEVHKPFAALDLTPQEQTFLRLEVQTLSLPEIAGRLGIEASSARQYRTRISKKLGVTRGKKLSQWAEEWWAAQMRAPT